MRVPAVLALAPRCRRAARRARPEGRFHDNPALVQRYGPELDARLREMEPGRLDPSFSGRFLKVAIHLKYGFSRLIDLASAEPIVVAKHGRPVVVVLSVEEYERLRAL